jgi:hypothetical protein
MVITPRTQPTESGFTGYRVATNNFVSPDLNRPCYADFLAKSKGFGSGTTEAEDKLSLIPLVTPHCRPSVSPDGMWNRRRCHRNPNFSWNKGAGNNFYYEIDGSSLDYASHYITRGSHTATWALQPNTCTTTHWAYIIVVFELNQCLTPSFTQSHCQCYTGFAQWHYVHHRLHCREHLPLSSLPPRPNGATHKTLCCSCAMGTHDTEEDDDNYFFSWSCIWLVQHVELYEIRMHTMNT